MVLEFGKENVALKTLELQERLTEIFQHLHENPEVSWKEYETTAYIRHNECIGAGSEC